MKREARRGGGRRPARPTRGADGIDQIVARRLVQRARLRFALIFGATALVLFSIYAFPYSDAGAAQRLFAGYLRGYAHLAGAAIGMFDPQVAVTDNVITGRFSLSIVKTCDAMEANLLFLAAVVAFPAPWWRRTVAAAAGVALLVVLNLIRICSLYFMGVYAPSVFEVAHIDIWPALIIVAAVGQFVAWTFWMTRPPLAPSQV